MIATINESILEAMKIAARKAGKEVMESYGKVEVKRKEVSEHYTGFDKIKKSFVTEIDRESQKTILKELTQFNNISVIAEEKNEEINKLISQFSKDSEYKFVIDPLDGTSNYLLGNPKVKGFLAKEYLEYYKEEMPDNSDKFGVCISLTKNNLPFHTVVYYPFYNQLMHAVKGKGTFMDEKEFKISSKKNHNFEDSIRISQYSRINKCKHLFTNRKSYQSSSFNLKAIIEGDIISYCLDSIDYSDFCPTLLAYSEAGGFFGDVQGNKIEIQDIINSLDDNGRINKFMILCPTQEYCLSLLENLRLKGLSIKF